MDKRWHILESEPHIKNQLVNSLHISPLLAQLLVNRGLKTPETARLFLKPELSGLGDPFRIPGMNKAIQRINQALTRNERIAIYGDYDVDGIAATVLLIKVFELMGRTVDFYIPHRIEEGYSLNQDALDRLARKGVQLIITVDCGVCDEKEVAYARESGIDIIITDHHKPLQDASGRVSLPDATAIINPKIEADDGQPFSELSGVGVAFKLVWALTQTLSPARKASPAFRDFLMEAMSLVALGTVADVVPLTGENRIFVAYGLEALRQTRIMGLKALIQKAGLNQSFINATSVAFRIAPRLNAGGRLGTAQVGVELLLSQLDSRIEEIVELLERTNRERQKIERKILKQAREKVREECNLDEDFVIVLADKTWHPGVIGIVSARIAEEFYRPTVLISLKNKQGKGSARSIPCFHLYQALSQCRDILTNFGGHSYAAGLEVAEERIAPLRGRLNEIARGLIKKDDLTPCLTIDAQIPLSSLNKPLVKEIQKFSPFGQDNPEPVFASVGVRLAGQPRLMGSKNEHLSFFVSQQDASFRVVAYKMGPEIDKIIQAAREGLSLAYTPKINKWQGEETLELVLKDIKL